MCLDKEKEKKIVDHIEDEKKSVTTFLLYSIAILVPPVTTLKLIPHYSVAAYMILIILTLSTEILLVTSIAEKHFKIMHAERLFWEYKRKSGDDKKRALGRLLAYLHAHFKNIFDKE